MALEPAGVDLQAKGFQSYLRKLEDINKVQRQVFDTEFKGTDKSFADVTRAAKQYERELKQLNQAQKRSQQEAQKLAAAQQAAAAAQRTAFLGTAQAVLQFTTQTAKAVFELGKLGAQFQGQQTGLNNLAASFGQAGSDIQKAVVSASKGTVSDLEAIQAANLGLLLGVAKTPAEFEKLTSTALTLGRTLGLTSTQSLEQFTTALGRQSVLILDNFGVSASQVNAEIERLARQNFGTTREGLTDAQKQAVFMEAALNKASESAGAIGDEAGEAAAAFDRLAASSENFRTELGVAISNLNQTLGITDAIAREINQATEALRVFRGAGEDASLDEQIEATEIQIKNLRQTLEDTQAGLERGGGFRIFGIDTGLFEGALAGLDTSAIEMQEAALSELESQLNQLNLEKAAEDQKKFKDEIEDTEPAIEENTKALEAYQQAIQQAEQLQLSFSRAAEDAALKLARQNEDVARKQAKSVRDLEERQAKDRDKLLKQQQKQLDKFEAGRLKQISKAESDIQKEREKAADQRRKDQQKLQRDLARAQERFNLSQLQSERRFKLSERRLRAEGDILGLQELREDRELERQEETENFSLNQKNRVQDASEKQREQTKDLDSRLKELKANLEDQRAELLTSFDEQLQSQIQAQQEARDLQQRRFAEEAEERRIALQREEEDRRISQQRQLEDLGRSFADQEGVTKEGTEAIAAELEKAFGIEGAADAIFTGFTDRTESKFKKLFENVGDIINKEAKKITKVADSTNRRTAPLVSLTGSPNIASSTPATLPEFQEGGIVPGPIGSPQLIQAHGGETVLPTHQRSFTMAAPVVPSQELNVNMSGGFNITGDRQADEAILQAATREMTDNFRIAVQRLERRN